MFKRTFQFLYDALTAQRESPQIALAIALGIAIGILPKGNLIAVLFVVLLFTLRTNLAAGLLSAAICSWIGVGLDPISHRVGEAVLTFGPLQGLFAGLYRLPYAPWLSFNNTVVMGGLLIGLLQMPLTYFWCRRMFADRQAPQPERPAVPPPKMKRSSREQRRYVIGGDGASYVAAGLCAAVQSLERPKGQQRPCVCNQERAID